MKSAFRLRMLGPVQIEHAGHTVTGFESRKALSLFCYLAVSNQPISRSQLVDLFWPDKPEKRGRGNLSRVLSNISSLIPNCIQADRHAVRFLQNDDIWMDIATFDALTKQVDVVSLKASLDLYRGDFLSEIFLDDCPVFETWLVGEREHWRQQISDVLNDLIAHHLGRREYRRALSLTVRLVELNTWREEGHRLMMLLLAINGERSAALKQFETCRKVLAEELNVEPTEATTSLFERISQEEIDEEIEIEHIVPHARRLIEHGYHLPIPATPFWGREKELSDIDTLLADPHCRLLTLVGLGGIGKTRLALEAASRLNERYADGIHFIPLDTLSSAEHFVPFLADAMKFFVYELQDPKAQLLNYLRKKEILLVMDNFEHLLDAADLLSEILQDAPRLKFLVTSRERLNLKEERVFEVKGLEIPGQKESSEGFSAVQMFVGSAQRGNAEFSLTKENESAVFQICRQLEGIPLGLELAASSTRFLTCDEIVEQIEKSADFFSSPVRDIPKRHRNMRAVFEHSWQLLNATGKNVFMKLAVFRGGFEREAFLHITQAPFALLRTLMDKSLLRRSPSDRYQIHELLRQYAADRLQENDSVRALTECRHSEYFAAYLQQAERALLGKGQKDALESILEELENIRLGWRWAIRHQRKDLVEMALSSLSYFYDLRSQYHEGAQRFESALNGLEFENRINSLKGKLLARRGLFALHQAQHEEAKRVLEEGLDIAQQLKQPEDEAYAHSILGEIAYALGEFEQAENHYHKGLDFFKTIDHKWGVATCINNLGNVAWSQGKYDQAKRLHEEGLAIRKSTGDQWGIAASLNNLGAVAYHQKSYVEAKKLFEEGLAIRNQLDDRLGIAACLNNLGEIARMMAQYDDAQHHHQESLAIRREIGDRLGIAYSLNNLGDTAISLDDDQTARSYFQEAIQTALDIEAIPAVVYMLVGMAALLVKEKKEDSAVELLSFIQNHPTSGQDTQDRAANLLSWLTSNMPAKLAESALTSEKTKSLETWVNEIFSQ